MTVVVTTVAIVIPHPVKRKVVRLPLVRTFREEGKKDLGIWSRKVERESEDLVETT